MKLRINDNSLRSEVANVREGARMAETIQFTSDAAARLTYALER
jgi:hypothetical protein